MKRLVLLAVCVAPLSCSSTSEKPKTAPGGDLVCPVAAGSTLLGGALEVVSVKRHEETGVTDVAVRATGGRVEGFARARWYADASRKREFLTGADPWTPIRVEAGKQSTLRIQTPYPFAKTVGLEVAAKKPAAANNEGKAVPGRLVITPAQEKELALYRYPDLDLVQYESAHAGAPKLAVWRNRQGKVVAALEIYVRPDAKAPAAGIRFLHTNGMRQIGSSLAYANTKKGAASADGWDFVVFRQADGREVAAPWRPLAKNASYAGLCAVGGEGLDAAQLGESASIGSFGADGSADLETAALEAPSWSMANPTRGTLSSGATITCQYSGTKAQRWTIRITDEMVFTPTSGEGGGKFACGTLPAGTGATELGTLRAARPGKHQFLYTTETLEEDTTCPERLTTSDGPVCPGDDASAATEILTDPGKECASSVPGSATRPVGSFTELVVPSPASGGTAIHVITQKGEDPGFVAVACDGDEKQEDLGFDATPVTELDATNTFIEIDNGVFMCPDPPPISDDGEPDPIEDTGVDEDEVGCTCEGCRLIVVIGPTRGRLPPGWDRDDMMREMDDIADSEFDLDTPPARRDAARTARYNALIGGSPLYRTNGPRGFDVMDLAIHAARQFARNTANATRDPHFHVLFYDSLDAGGTGAATMLAWNAQRGRREDKDGFRNSPRPPARNLASHFSNCHKWSELLFIFHGDQNNFQHVAAQIPRMITTPVRRIVFWSCWGADRIDVNGAEFTALKNHLVASRCSCPGRRPPMPVPPAAHDAAACTACPGPPDHCPYEGTTIITAGTIRARVRGAETDIAVPLGIDFRQDPAHPRDPGRYVLTSPDSVVRVIDISPEGTVTETTQRGGTVFGDIPLESDPGLGDRARQRNGAR